MSVKTTPEQRALTFWKKVLVKDATECWPWIGAIGKHGYGCTSWNTGRYNASRLAWILTHGDPGELVVCHKCDVPACCNPSHLFLGTPGDNVRDCQRKGRGRAHFELGKPHPRYSAKLTEEAVREARRLYASGISQTELGRRYGVHSSTMSRAIRGEKWAHIA
jgi:hypothetical protein